MRCLDLIRSALWVCLALASLAAHPATLTLQPRFAAGWNLAGNSSDAAIDVAATFGASGVRTNVLTVWKWDANLRRWQFYSPQLSFADLAAYAGAHGYDLLQNIAAGEGYWVNAVNAFALPMQLTGASRRLGLSSSWNLSAAGRSLGPEELSTLVKDGASSEVISLWAWDNAQGRWLFHAPASASQGADSRRQSASQRGFLDFIDSGRRIEPGAGFWLNAANAGAATVVPDSPAIITGNGTLLFSSPRSRIAAIDVAPDGTRTVFYQTPPPAGQAATVPSRVSRIAIDDPLGGTYELSFDSAGLPQRMVLKDVILEVTGFSIANATVSVRVTLPDGSIANFPALDVSDSIETADLVTLGLQPAAANAIDPFAETRPCPDTVDSTASWDTIVDCAFKAVRHIVWESGPKGHVSNNLALNFVEQAPPAVQRFVRRKVDRFREIYDLMVDRMRRASSDFVGAAGSVTERVQRLAARGTKLYSDPVLSVGTGNAENAALLEDAQRILAADAPSGLTRLPLQGVLAPPPPAPPAVVTPPAPPAQCLTEAECPDFTNGGTLGTTESTLFWKRLRCPMPFTAEAEVNFGDTTLKFTRGQSGLNAIALPGGESVAMKGILDALNAAGLTRVSVICRNGIPRGSSGRRAIEVLFSDFKPGLLESVTHYKMEGIAQLDGEWVNYQTVAGQSVPRLRRNFRDGVANGPHIEYAGTQVSISGQDTNGYSSGEWTTFDATGSKVLTRLFATGGAALPYLIRYYWPGGKVKEEVEYPASIAAIRSIDDPGWAGLVGSATTRYYNLSGTLCPATWQIQATCI